jgi:hypothetical protein
MPRFKLRTMKLWNNVALLGWAVLLACVLSLVLYGAMIAAAYVSDEFHSPLR